MINPLSIATDGYLSVANRVLTIAVAGYLSFSAPPPPPPSSGSAGGGGSDMPDKPRPSRYIDQQSTTEVFDYELDDEEAILVAINAFLHGTSQLP